MAVDLGPRLGLLINANSGEQYVDQFRPFLRAIDELLMCGVINSTTTTPPASPNNGDAYLLLGSPTGAWEGQADSIAIWSTEITQSGSNTKTPGWEFRVPNAGWLVWDTAASQFKVFYGGAWHVFSQIQLQTNGTNNGSQSKLNLKAGSNITLTDDGTGDVTVAATSSGTVDSIGVTTANGVSGTSSGGSNPSLTLALGAITPSSVAINGSQAITGVQGSTGTKLLAESGMLTSGHLISADANGNAVDSTIATNNVPLLNSEENIYGVGTFQYFDNVEINGTVSTQTGNTATASVTSYAAAEWQQLSSVWNGTTAVKDNWAIGPVFGAGSNPTSTLSIQHETIDGNATGVPCVQLTTHLAATGTAPTVTAEAGAGTGATVSIAGNDTRGTITINTGTSPAAGATDIVAVTFNQPYVSTPVVVVSFSGFNGADMNGITLQTAMVSTTGFTIAVGTGATWPASHSGISISYIVIG